MWKKQQAANDEADWSLHKEHDTYSKLQNRYAQYTMTVRN